MFGKTIRWSGRLQGSVRLELRRNISVSTACNERPGWVPSNRASNTAPSRPGWVSKPHANWSTPSWATVDPDALSPITPGVCQNLVGGAWRDAESVKYIVDPLNGDDFIVVPDTKSHELDDFVASAQTCPKAGLHNPLLNVERYVLYGDVASRAAVEMANPMTERFFIRLIQRVVPKHDVQCYGEVNAVRRWLQSFAGDSVRQLGRSFGVPGDHFQQETRGYRWPYGQVAMISPFNFPLEIPSIQTVSALMMGNRPLCKVDEKVSIVMEQFIRMLIHCGMPAEDLDLLYSDGMVANELLLRTKPRLTMFTGSQQVAEKLCAEMKGKVKLEDAGFDWKVLGPDVQDFEYVVWQSDQDAYAFSGQKCSAQSIVFVHENWSKAGFMEAIKERAAMRSLDNLTISPVLTVSNEQMSQHIEKVLEIPGAELVFGGSPIDTPHNIPDRYGSFQPTAIFVPIDELVKDQYYDLVTTEIFGPFQILTEYNASQLENVHDALERMEHNLTAAVISNDPDFLNPMLSRTVNGTTYAGLRARTTGAPVNHWFGPAGDPRAGGIHTIEAIQQTWSCHREVILDFSVPQNWEPPAPT